MVVTLWYYRLKSQKGRIMLLLIASCYFYMSFVPIYILILGFTTVVDYLAGILIERTKGKTKKLWLVSSIIANVGVLAYFKYYNFFIDNLNETLSLLGSSKEIPFLSIILPIGLSFHTFQAMSYTIEVYWGKQKAEYHFPTYALYVMYYPQLVAGPIERPQNIIPQLKTFQPYNKDSVKEGISRMLWGFFKKVVIADRLAIAVDRIFANSESSSSLALAIGAILYAFQIYCDFSGYSDIGIGAAKVMNLKLMENFSQPYLSRNISAFWSRWHISLSSWFRDYVYIPLGGNRKGEVRRRINVFIVFLLSGLWHGANWTFGVWGLLHGTLVTLFPGKVRDRAGASINLKNAKTAFWIVVNFILVTIFWIFFRAENIGHATSYLSRMFSMSNGNNDIGLNSAELIFSLLLIVIMLWKENRLPNHFIKDKNKYILYVVGMIFACYFFGVFGENQFIYFQF